MYSTCATIRIIRLVKARQTILSSGAENKQSYNTASIVTVHANPDHTQGAYKFGKMKFPEFSRPLKQSFPHNYNVITRCNEPPYLTIGTFLALMQNYRIYC